MIVSALVVTLAPEPHLIPSVIAALGRDPRLMLGEAIACRLPVVAETESAAAGVQLCEELERLEGVARVDVVSIDFASEPAAVR